MYFFEFFMSVSMTCTNTRTQTHPFKEKGKEGDKTRTHTHAHTHTRTYAYANTHKYTSTFTEGDFMCCVPCTLHAVLIWTSHVSQSKFLQTLSSNLLRFTSMQGCHIHFQKGGQFNQDMSSEEMSSMPCPWLNVLDPMSLTFCPWRSCHQRPWPWP